MTNRWWAIGGVVIALGFTTWSLSLIDITKVSGLLNAEFTFADATVCLLLVVSTLAALIAYDLLRVLRKQRISKGFVSSRIAGIVGLLASNATVASTPSSTVAIANTQLTAAVSPAVAVSVLAQIERRRRNQIRDRIVPDQLSIEELHVLHDLQRSARLATTRVKTLHVEAEKVCPLLIHAVERTAPPLLHELTPAAEPWLIEVKVFGYPLVVSANGGVAVFRKKRALELLTWLSLNKDKARRSAARTALWDIDVSDSTFATVVSDMRRALRDLEQSHDGALWVPATYSDDLPLSELVTTDADRLRRAFQRYQQDINVDESELIDLLQGIRDVPFAGTNYAWADYDGTTTRLVISAVSICSEIARSAQSNCRNELLTLAISAGLRVLPGCEELLEIQEEFLASQFATRSSKMAQTSLR